MSLLCWANAVASVHYCNNVEFIQAVFAGYSLMQALNRYVFSGSGHIQGTREVEPMLGQRRRRWTNIGST